MIKKGNLVEFNIAQGLDKGKAYIIDNMVEEEDGKENIYYRLEVIEGSFSNLHRNKIGELWVNSFEVKKI